MRLLINASNLHFGGGLTVALKLLDSVVPLRPADEFHILCPQGKGYEELKGNNIFLHFVPQRFKNAYSSRLWYDQHYFKGLVKRLNIDKIVSLGNVALPAKGIPQLLYIQLPHLVYPHSPAWQAMNWRQYIRNRAMIAYITAGLRHASAFAVQTEVMKRRFLSRFHIKKEVFILPNAATQQTEVAPLVERAYTKANPLKLVFLSKWYPHKNFDLLLPLGQLIRQAQLPVQISLTIAAHESEGARLLIEQIKENDLEDIFPVAGHIPLQFMSKIWQEHDGLFLPSFLESFSGSYLEAAQAGRAIFTGKYDFAEELLGDRAFYFKASEATDVFATLKEAIDHPETMAQKAAQAKAWSSLQPGWTDVGRQFSEIIDRFA